MKEFWKNEWNLFLKDMQELGEFFLQPVEITGIPGKSSVKMLKPTVEEVQQKSSNGGFWANEWNLFLNDMEALGEFCLQPVDLTLPWQKKEEVVNSCAKTDGFWANEWDLFKQDIKTVKDFLTQPVEFK